MRSQFLRLSIVLLIAVALISTSVSSMNVLAQATAAPTVAATDPGATLSATAPAAQPTAQAPTVAPAVATPANVATSVPPAPTVAAPVAQPQTGTARCVPVEVAAFTLAPKIHVKCQSPTDRILFFAVSTEDAASAERVLMIMTSALTAGRALSIVYDPSNLTGETIGCLPQDCRLIVSVSIVR